MTVTTPTVTVTKVERNSGGGYVELTADTSGAWGEFIGITNPSGVHSEILVLHCADDGGSATWDTDDYRITFTLNAFSQTKGDTIYSKIFNGNSIPTTTATWSSDTVTVEFTSGNLDGYVNPDDLHTQSISFVATLDGSEWEGTTGNDIAGYIVFIIDAMPTLTIANEPTSFSFDNDIFSFDSGDSGQTVDVTVSHTSLPASGDYAILQTGGTPVTYTTNPFTTTLTDGHYLEIYVDRPFDNNATDVLIRTIDMTQNP